MIKALAKEYKISEKEVGIIWAKAYDDLHAFGMTEVYDKFCELADMYEELREVTKDDQNNSVDSAQGKECK